MLTTIDVTQAGIDAGERDDCKKCPVALAAKRLIRCAIEVGSRFITLYGFQIGCEDISIQMPMLVRHTIQAFDLGADIGPFTFTLDIPDEYLARKT